jgi:hypothetical protein
MKLILKAILSCVVLLTILYAVSLALMMMSQPSTAMFVAGVVLLVATTATVAVTIRAALKRSCL